MNCAYCERPLICDACRAAYVPPSLEAYQAVSRPEVAIPCAACGALLICHWCQTPYDGREEGDDDGPGD